MTSRFTSTVGRTNWAGNYAYRPARFHEPESIEEAQEIVRAASAVRVLGSRHSFNDIADTPGDLVSLARIPRTIEMDVRRRRVTIDGGIRYGELCGLLDEAGWALHNLASLPHISVAGACATASHGSGDRSGNLATAVASMEVVTADGELGTFDRGRDGGGVEFDGAVVSLGGLGVVTKLTLDVQPTFRVRQDVYEHLPFARLVDEFDEITSSADSVSLFTDWRGSTFDEVWLKRRVATGSPFEPSPDFHGATLATVALHPIRSLPADACTQQLGVEGPWHERLPHFRLDHTPSSGAELQTEYVVPRSSAVDALLALDAIGDRIAPLVQISEVRTIAADELWMSPAYERPSVAIHFTWHPDWEAVRALLPLVEGALARFEPRPHWGKLFTMAPEEVRSRYERLPGFADLLHRHDPAGKFRNAFLDRFITG